MRSIQRTIARAWKDGSAFESAASSRAWALGYMRCRLATEEEVDLRRDSFVHI